MQRFIALLPVLVLVVTCSSTRSTATSGATSAALLELQKTMTGSFNSGKQAASDESYYNIALHMEPIWTGRPGSYLYVEQALASTPQEPYRQRVYKLEQKGSKTFISRVYELPEPEKYVGGHLSVDRFNTISLSDLKEREGCAVYLEMESPGRYRGSTEKDKCKSSLRGATYATSQVVIGETIIQSWDQGFDAEGKQVWGATKGGYIFSRE